MSARILVTIIIIVIVATMLGLQAKLCALHRYCLVSSLLIYFVLASGPNQVQTFLTEHGGPGIQHIGLHTSNITEAVAALKDNGVKFIDPPAAYYSEVCHRGFLPCSSCFKFVTWSNKI